MARSSSAQFRAVLLLAATTLSASLDDGLARTPPMGWRSWNTFGANVDQPLLAEMMRLVADRSRALDGVPTSLCDLGFCDVGLDDGWQACGAHGAARFTYHTASGAPIVDRARFPDLEALTAHAHSLGLTAGWYLNNCICADHCDSAECYAGDAVALLEFGFDSVKLDGCGAQLDLDRWARLFADSGRKVLVENCHWGRTLPTADWCPFHTYRTSNDIRPSYASVVNNLLTVAPLARAGLSRPGCWAYPDMLELGCPNGGAAALSAAESRAHFGAWCITSAPLVLSHDLRDAAAADAVWAVVANREAIAVNQAWAGASGGLFASAAENTTLVDAQSSLRVPVPRWQFWAKPLSGGRVAVLLMNHDQAAASLALDFESVPRLARCEPAAGCAGVAVRDVWARKTLGVFDGGRFVAKAVGAHDAAFLVLALEPSAASPRGRERAGGGSTEAASTGATA